MFDHSKYAFINLTGNFEKEQFDCGVHSLNYYLKNHALKNQELNISQTYILHKIGDQTIIGYYTLSATNTIKSELPDPMTKHFPNYPIPALLIGKLAVDKKYQTKGLGKYILYDALKRAKEISKLIGCFAVVVDTFNDNVVDFYKKYGFIQFINKKSSLFIPIESIPQ